MLLSANPPREADSNMAHVILPFHFFVATLNYDNKEEKKKEKGQQRGETLKGDAVSLVN